MLLRSLEKFKSQGEFMNDPLRTLYIKVRYSWIGNRHDCSKTIDKSEEDLDAMVEYDMDSEDETWLKETNEKRKKSNLVEITEDDFEYMIDRLEKESFAVVLTHSFFHPLNSIHRIYALACLSGAKR
jgi:hypothetical protein